MLPAGMRITDGADYAAVMKNGRRAKRGAVVVHLANRTKNPVRTARAGFIVSKAVGPAVTRNRVKRRLRHLTAPRLTTLPNGTELVIRALPNAAARTYAQLSRDVDDAVAALTRSRR